MGNPSREVPFASGVPGLAIVPEGARHPDGAFSWVAVPARDFALWALRAVEQIAEGLLVPGVIGYHFDDMRLMVGTERRLQFSYAASEIGILDASAQAIAQARNWLPWSSNLLVRMAGTRSSHASRTERSSHLACECGEHGHQYDVLRPDWPGNRFRDHGGVAWSASPSDGRALHSHLAPPAIRPPRKWAMNSRNTRICAAVGSSLAKVLASTTR